MDQLAQSTTGRRLTNNGSTSSPPDVISAARCSGALESGGADTGLIASTTAPVTASTDRRMASASPSLAWTQKTSVARPSPRSTTSSVTMSAPI